MPVAEFMASMLSSCSSDLRILDPGAGCGSLTAACIARILKGEERPEKVTVTAFELDASLEGPLRRTLQLCEAWCSDFDVEFEAEVVLSDFLAYGVEAVLSKYSTDTLFRGAAEPFNCAILNPPYRKISTDSVVRASLRRVGIEATNLYAAFLALTIRLLEPGGEVVAIVPRSFCNGTYFRPFRKLLLSELSLRRLHVFESRHEVFRDDAVLQENVIIHGVRSPGQPRTVLLSTSSGPGDPVVERSVRIGDVVHEGDPDQFIRLVPDGEGDAIAELMASLPCTLADLDLTVSTGRVVDFRARAHLRAEPGRGTVPLVYPGHFDQREVRWPRENLKKPNAIAANDETEDLLVPNGNYVLVRRFSAKEERRRVVAAICRASALPGPTVGFENHLNYFHSDGRGLGLRLATGLTAYLNSSFVDAYFRQFSGHTQVNAADLRSIRYPSADSLRQLGTQLRKLPESQGGIDRLVDDALQRTSQRSTIEPAPHE
jgi:adenine-specific DNA-methyltransferase